jgi:hypothetical protein
MNVLYIKSYYLLLITYYQAGEARAARGIVAEPPKRGGTHREGDGADSPTRAKRSGSPKSRLQTQMRQ